MTGEVRRGDLWRVDFGDPESPESGLRRPALVVSSDRMHTGRLTIVCPLTTTMKPYPWRVEIESDAGNGLAVTSYVQVEHVRSISTTRLRERIGAVDGITLATVQRVLDLLLGR